MKKVFTLLALLLSVCSGAWAQDADFNSPATKSYGSLTFLDVENTINNTTSSDGDKYLCYGAYFVAKTKKITTWYNCSDSKPDSNMDDGKVCDFSGQGFIKVTSTNQTSTNGDAGVKVHNARMRYYYVTGTSGVAVLVSEGGKRYTVVKVEEVDENGSLTSVGEETCSEYNTTEAHVFVPSITMDASKYYKVTVSGSNGSNNILHQIRFTQPSVAKTITSKTLTGININGTAWNIAGLSENAATITDECAGPPTVDFVYVENYDDNTSSSNKTESIVAVKDNGSYKAVSTALTNNVTLTFTNVSNVLFSMTDPTAPTEGLASTASSAVTATFSPGGSAIVYNGHGSAEAQMIYADEINLNGSGNSYFQANFTASLAEGDVITSSNTNEEIFKVGISNAQGSATVVTFPYTIPTGSNLIGKKTVYVFKNNTPATFATFTITRPKTIDSQELGSVKKGETTLTENTDYTVSGTTITLTDAHKAVIAPTDIVLVNHITYDDETTADEDVAVTLTQNEDFFVGTATIGLTTYTVKVPVDTTTPILTLSAASGKIELASYIPTGSVKVTLTGANLANGTFTAPTADGVTVEPASVEITDGTLSQEFTITSTASTAASTSIVFAYDGAESQTYTLTYTKAAKRELTRTDVTEATIWDWTKSGGASIELKDNTDPKNGDEFLLAALPEITNDETFNSQALLVACQWPNRGNSYYLQGNTIKFNVTVPGTVQVWFQNTSNRSDSPTNRRFLYINNVNQGVYTLRQDAWENVSTYVPAGEVIINAFTGEEKPAATMVRINKIIFTPAPATITKEITSAGYATLCSEYPLDFTGSGVTAYIAKVSGTIVSFESVTSVPAKTGVLLKGEAGNKTINVAESSTDVSANKLVGVLEDTDVDGGIFVLMNDEKGVGFYKTTATTFTVGANTAYLPADVVAEARFIGFGGGETTGIDATLVNHEMKDKEVYDLQGRRVNSSLFTLHSSLKKGVYIVNGKKTVVK